MLIPWVHVLKTPDKVKSYILCTYPKKLSGFRKKTQLLQLYIWPKASSSLFYRMRVSVDSGLEKFARGLRDKMGKTTVAIRWLNSVAGPDAQIKKSAGWVWYRAKQRQPYSDGSASLPLVFLKPWDEFVLCVALFQQVAKWNAWRDYCSQQNTPEIWPQRPRYFAAAILIHMVVSRGWHIMGGWHISLGGGLCPGGGLTLVLTWLMTSRGVASMGG